MSSQCGARPLGLPWIFVLLLCGVLFFCGCAPSGGGLSGEYLEECAGGQKSEEYLLCKQFVDTKLTGADGGIFTNYLPEPSGALTKGHDVLSESMGLMLGICAQVGDGAGFARAWEFTRDKLMTRKGLFAWRLAGDEAASSNAAVDDLRIAGALYSGAVRFGEDEYKSALERVSKALLRYNVKGGLPASSADFKGSGASWETHLSYLDLYSMRKLSVFSSRWDKIYKNSLALIEDGRAGNFPLFWDEYERRSGEYKKTESLDLLTSMVTFYNLCHAGEIRVEDIKWLKDRLGGEGLFAKYSLSGEADSQLESTAAYALVMLSARAMHDDVLYDLAKEKMCRFQITDEKSEIYGAFGDKKTLQVYSFDNLLALWALALG